MTPMSFASAMDGGGPIVIEFAISLARNIVIVGDAAFL